MTEQCRSLQPSSPPAPGVDEWNEINVGFVLGLWKVQLIERRQAKHDVRWPPFTALQSSGFRGASPSQAMLRCILIMETDNQVTAGAAGTAGPVSCNGEPTHVHTAGPGSSLSVRLWGVTESFDLSENKVCATSGRYPFPSDILGLVTVKFQQNYTTKKE